VQCAFLPAKCTLLANSPKDLGDYWAKVHEIFTRNRGINSGVNTTIHVVILPSVVDRQHRE